MTQIDDRGPAAGSGGTLFSLLDRVAAEAPERLALAAPGRAPLTYAGLRRHVLETAGALRALGIRRGEDWCMKVMPLFHSHGLAASLLASVAAGASVVCGPGFLAPRFFEWLEAFHPTWYTAVPTMHQAILARSEENRDVIRRCPLR